MASGRYDEKPLAHHDLHLQKNTQLLYGAEKAVGKGVEFMKNVKHQMDITFDHKAPSIVIEIPQYYSGYEDILKRGGKIRCITEITKENLQYCEKLVNSVTELRHMEGLKGGIAISETEYMATTVLQESQPLTEVIYSNVDEVVAQGQFIFDTLWKNSIPGKKKIKELKEGIRYYETKLITESNDSLIEDEFNRVIHNSSKIDVCTSIDGLRISKNILVESLTNALTNEGINSPKRIRILVDINRGNLEIVKELLDLGIQVRHIKNMSSVDYTVTNSDLIIAVKRAEKNDPNDSILYSNDPSYLDHFANVFEELWKNSKDPERVIKSLEEETELSFIETIDDPEESMKLVRALISSAKYEILAILPNFNSFLRQVESGMMEFMKYISLSKKNVSIRILIVEETDNEIQHKILTIFDRFNGKTSESTDSEIPWEFKFKGVENFKLKILNSKLFTEIGFLIVDKNKSLIIESKNTPSIDMTESIGLSSYSNSHRISKSYGSIFEALWNQAELYDKLKLQDKLQKEFINIAAHELRNPVQSLLGYSDILMNTTGNIESHRNFVVTINQNTKKLARLIDKVLNVTQLENELLILNKEKFCLEELVIEIVREYKNTIHLLNKNQLEIRYESRLNDFNKNTNSQSRRSFEYVFADRTLIIQVIMNLLENAVEYTDMGTITLRLDKNKSRREILLTVSDSGRGIDLEVLPNLFNKFVSKSRKGTGLGLYISKKIIEAHEGKIWAENCYNENNEIEGSKFTLTLPLIDN